MSFLLVDVSVSVVLLIMFGSADGASINNGIVGLPEVGCSESSISIRVKTERPFVGRAFVKGMVRDKRCVRDYSRNVRLSNEVSLMLPIGSCGMERRRQLSPSAVVQTLVVVITFHPIFITKVDKAYHVRCTYTDSAKLVTQQLGVSMLTTQPMAKQARIDTQCHYSIRRNSVKGPLVRYAKVGEKLFHVWKCNAPETVGMLVRNCQIQDGTNSRFQALDGRGCPADNVIMGLPSYGKDLNMVWLETHAFKFADNPSLYFKCEIALCNRNDASADKSPISTAYQLPQSTCAGLTPPVCDRRQKEESARRKRSTNQQMVMDISPENEYLLIFDEEEGVSNDNNTTEKRTKKPMQNQCGLGLSGGIIFVVLTIILLVLVMAGLKIATSFKQKIDLRT